VLEVDHDDERFVGITGALSGKLTEAFELAIALEKEAHSDVLLRESAHRIAIDAHRLRARVQRLQGDLVDQKTARR
jgi:hypothetical protein